MAEITAVLFDVGGVLLTNGWDRTARARAVARFGLDADEFEERHDLVVGELEAGRLSLDDYLERTVFHRERDFSPAQVIDFMRAQSQADPDALALARGLREASGRPLLATLNNESKELNEYRIRTFGLRSIFDVFFSSCYLGVAKPSEAAYREALALMQRPAGECVFVDDRPLNVEVAGRLGLNAIHYRGAEPLRAALARLGLRPATPRHSSRGRTSCDWE